MNTPPRLSGIRDFRLAKRQALLERGLQAYPTTSGRTHYAAQINSHFEEYADSLVTVAGRLVSWRKQGALVFGHILDTTGKIQLFMRRDPEAPSGGETLGFEDLSLVDVGDIVEVSGRVMKTRVGEVSVQTSGIRVLTKSLRPLPDKWAGIQDRELVLRKRYLDVILDGENRERFRDISRMLTAIRSFLDKEGFLEFATPVLQPQYGGGTARPFRTHVNALDFDAYLAISHELYLKRLIIAGYDKVYTIGKYFRNEGIDRSHHPEFSMVETMTAYHDYRYNMDLIEAMFRSVAAEAFKKTRFTVRGHEIDFAEPWRRASMADLVRNTTGHDFRNIPTLGAANATLAEMGIEPQVSVGHALVRAFEVFVEPTLIHPTLVFGHPVEVSPLAKPSVEDPRYAERFEIFIAGMECGDNWSEQNDPVALLEEWKRARQRTSDEDSTHPLDYDFIEALEYGMPPTTGIGPGIERMAMILSGQENIDDVIFFPILRPSLSDANRRIYDVETQAADAAELGALEHTVVLDAGEFADLVRRGVISPIRKNLLVLPSIRFWSAQSHSGQRFGSGHLTVRGFLPVDLAIVGYRVGSDLTLTETEESAAFLDMIDLEFVQTLRALYPDLDVQVGRVRFLKDPASAK